MELSERELDILRVIIDNPEFSVWDYIRYDKSYDLARKWNVVPERAIQITSRLFTKIRASTTPTP